MVLSDQEFQGIAGLMAEKFGVFLKPEKKILVVNRLQKLVSERGFPSYQEYYEHLVRDATGQALIELADQLTTNFSYFDRVKPILIFFKRRRCRSG